MRTCKCLHTFRHIYLRKMYGMFRDKCNDNYLYKLHYKSFHNS